MPCLKHPFNQPYLKLSLLLTLACLLLFTTQPTHAQTNQPVYWQYDTPGQLQHLIAQDITRNGTDNFLLLVENDTLLLLQADGQRLWEFIAPEPILQFTPIYFNGPLQPAHIAFTTRNHVTLLDHQGEQLWTKILDRPPGSNTAAVSLLTSADKERWQSQQAASPAQLLPFDPLNNDQEQLIITLKAGLMLLLDDQGEIQWRYPNLETFSDDAAPQVTTGDLDQDGENEILFAYYQPLASQNAGRTRVAVIEANGLYRWQRSITGTPTHLTLAPFNDTTPPISPLPPASAPNTASISMTIVAISAGNVAPTPPSPPSISLPTCPAPASSLAPKPAPSPITTPTAAVPGITATPSPVNQTVKSPPSSPPPSPNKISPWPLPLPLAPPPPPKQPISSSSIPMAAPNASPPLANPSPPTPTAPRPISLPPSPSSASLTSSIPTMTTNLNSLSPASAPSKFAPLTAASPNTAPPKTGPTTASTPAPKLLSPPISTKTISPPSSLVPMMAVSTTSIAAASSGKKTSAVPSPILTTFPASPPLAKPVLSSPIPVTPTPPPN
ncbi:MAG TPA: hypothetical protein VLL52_11600 [Anaerolineae bacterium]|nr:hypothetical protein [Anaerolineae bacterium]